MCYDLRLVESLARSNSRSGACEDSAEVCAPYIGILPDESETADGSPLDFGRGIALFDRIGAGEDAVFWEARVQRAAETRKAWDAIDKARAEAKAAQASK